MPATCLDSLNTYAIGPYLISGRKTSDGVRANWEEEEVSQGHFWLAGWLGTIRQMQNQVKLSVGYSA